ncbi:DUF6118 family protein [Sphingobium sp. RSMS]|uniref:DUF6118 family protein n=1 Tax=Sphingobium sp. RSMS TaxID=520734 RepID=UPI0010FA0E55|nr:DUF6118 family protein [Sphingobium sp. RSMS]UXC91407.1 DUF6118 family protein [Sphingobium sp. RSMS]
MDDEEQSLLNVPEPVARPDAAAEAFAALSQRVAGMEERLDGRMAMITRALEHIAIERQSIEIPDYTPTLAKIGGHLATLAPQMKRLADAPTMQLTPESMAGRIAEAAKAARETDKATIGQSLDLHRRAHADLGEAIGKVRTRTEQRWHMLYTGIGTALTVSLLWLVYPGWAADIGPQGWRWPERVARRTMGEPTLWDAGIRLMRAGNPEGWQAIVEAANLARENRDAIAACEKTAEKAKKPVRCTIRIGPSQP